MTIKQLHTSDATAVQSELTDGLSKSPLTPVELYKIGYDDGINCRRSDDDPRRELAYEHGYFEGNCIRRSTLEFEANDANAKLNGRGPEDLK